MATLLSACGGDEGPSSTVAAPAKSTPEAQPASKAPMTQFQASRFLAHATNGPTRDEIAKLSKTGPDRWLRDQFAMARGVSHFDWLKSQGYQNDDRSGRQGWDNTVWRGLIGQEDQLRQRVGLALLDIFVVGILNLPMKWRQFAMASYMDVLLDNAFGNFRDLLGAVTTNVAMASFLTYLTSQKESSAGAVPDENYARELMQLFTIGLYELNQDGTLVAGPDGRPIETYTQQDITQLSRVFTGLRMASAELDTPDGYRHPLKIDKALNETGVATFLGTSVKGGGMGAINGALDAIFNHRNTAPFFAKNLIKRLVTSNPSPQYVKRVADAFAGAKGGRRGDMKATITAVLTDDEAMSNASLANANGGKIRDPIQRITNWARAFGVNSKSGAWEIGDITSWLGQSPGKSPTVFNFFRPNYSPPKTIISARNMVAPEFQITDEQSVFSYVNFLERKLQWGFGQGDAVGDYAECETLADDPAALVEDLNLLLAAGQLTDTTKSLIAEAAASVPSGSSQYRLKRSQIAILLTMASPDYLVLK